MRKNDTRHNPYIAYAAKAWRKEHGYTLNDISFECGYDITAISKFEHGLADNYNILMAYIKLGMTLDKDLVEKAKYDMWYEYYLDAIGDRITMKGDDDDV